MASNSASKARRGHNDIGEPIACKHCSNLDKLMFFADVTAARVVEDGTALRAPNFLAQKAGQQIFGKRMRSVSNDTQY